VGADDVAGADALEAVAAVVAVTFQHATQGLRFRPEVRPAAVVLEPRQHPWVARFELDLDRDVSNQARPLGAHGLQIDQAGTRQRLITQLVGVTQQLVATTDRKDHRTPLRGVVQLVTLDLGEVDRAQLLITVLAATDVEQVSRVWLERVPEPARADLEAHTSPLAASLEQ